MANTTLTGAQILWESLVREGVNVVFGYPGGAILPAYDAMLDYPIRHILVRHEQGATHMADGYSRATGQVGVAIATSGPGATNMVTGLATAMLDSVPIGCITGQVGSKLIGSDAFQETDITGITLPVTKHNYLVTRADEVAKTVREAFYVARSGRPGPVLIDITKDAQQSSCEFVWPDPPKLRGYRPAHRPVAREIQHALDLIHSAKKPVILAGHGISISGAGDIVRKFAERTNIPVATTLLGIGAFPASHPLNLGMMGMHGEAWVNTAIQEADLLLAFGMRFDDRVTGNLKTYALNAKKIHIDINIAVINNGFLGMVRQWQEFFYERRYAATPMTSPDFVKLTEAFGLTAHRVETRAGVIPAVEAARKHPGTVLIDFRVEQEDSVFPMVPAGNDLHNMIRRPSAIVETGADA